MNEADKEAIELIRKIQKLSIRDKHTVIGIVEQLERAAGYNKGPNTTIEGPNNTKKETNVTEVFRFEIGDKVRILNNRKTGKKGDIAHITKFNKKFIALKLDKNNSYPQRESKNIEFIERSNLK